MNGNIKITAIEESHNNKGKILGISGEYQLEKKL